MATPSAPELTFEPVRLFVVDSFSSRPFRGNPAGVCVLSEAASEDWMQNIALELSLSETAFVFASDDGFDLRWFTPAVEVDLCGHATLAAAHILWEEKIVELGESIEFRTASGVLKVERTASKIRMNFPVEEAQECELPDYVLQAINAKPQWTGRNRMDYLVELADRKAVENVSPNLEPLKRLPRGLIVTARDSEYDFVSRFFAPAVGVAEDPVTGSAHCCLAPYWAAKLKRTKMTGHQLSQRGGIVDVELENSRVWIGGKAVTVFEVELRSTT